MKKFFIVAVTVLLVICFTFPTAAFAGTEETGSESPPTTTAGAPGDTTTTTTADTTTTTGSDTTTTTGSDTTTTISDTTTTDSSTTTSTVDATPPVIVLNGDAVINLKMGDIFTDPGATATDNIDASVAVIVSGTVDINIAGAYTLSYNATDAAGNVAITVTRTVNVSDATPPVIILNGNAVIDLKIGEAFTDPGATATDNIDANVVVTTTGTVNTNFASSYTLSYNASDAAGNAAATITRTVNVTSIATITTDKPDYLPDDYVLVTGSGWLPGETVKLDFHETLFDPIYQQTITYYTVADSEGNVRDLQYLIELRHLGASFILNATGQTSGLTAQTTFTDGKVTIRVTKVVKDIDGNIVNNDNTDFTIKLMKGIYPDLGAQQGSALTINGVPGTNVKSFPEVTNNSIFGVSADLWVTEDANPNYSVTISPQKTNATSGIVDVTITNRLTTPTTITIKKEVYEADGTTIDNDNTDSFTVELWTVDFFGGLDTLKSTVTLTGNQTSAPIAVVPGVKYVVKETTIDPNYKISYNPSSSIVYPDFSGTITPSAGSSDKVFIVKNTKTKSFMITKTGLKGYDRAKFTLYDPSNNIIKANLGLDSVTLDCSDGALSFYSDTYTWNNLPDGEGYRLVESYDVDVVPNDYVYTSNLTSNEYAFSINGASVSLSVINYAIGTIKAYKTDKAGLPLSGAQIGLFANINDTSPIIPAVTSSGVSGSPNVEFLNVPSGGTTGITYYIHEISAPAGYTADPGWYAINISDANLSPILGESIINKASGSITLYKKDNAGNALPGAVFGLYTAEDATLTPITATSDSSGVVEFTELTCGLTYYIREISAPFGFLVDENWYEVNLTTQNTPYIIEAPIVNVPGGTITVTKNVIAPDGKTDVNDPKEFTINLEKKDGSSWVPVKSATIKEGSPVVFSVPLGTLYRITETVNTKYTEINKADDVCLTSPGQNQDICITNKQHYALIVMGKIIYKFSSPYIITNDDHIFFTKLEGEFNPLIEWHPIATKIPTVFLVWPGTYTVVEKSDVNYNNNGQPLIISGFDLSDFDMEDLGDIGNLVSILFQNLFNGGGSQEITVEGDTISPLIIANQYSPQYGTVTVTKDVVSPDGSEASDTKEFEVQLQRLSLTLPNILDMLDLSGVGDVENLSDLMDILDFSDLSDLSNLIGWEDVGGSQYVSENNPVTFEGVEKDHIYRIVETQPKGYMQMSGMLPFYFDPENTNEQVEIVNRQEMIIIKVVKNVVAPDGSPVNDCHEFWVKLDGRCIPLYHPFSEGNPTIFAVLPGTYSASEFFDCDYDLSDDVTFTVNIGDGTICDPYVVTMVNKQKPAKITVRKDVFAPDGITDVTDTNPFNITLNEEIKAVAEGASKTWTVNPGSYNITEEIDPDYEVISITPNTVNVKSNGCAYVTVKNKQKPATITVEKNVFAPDGTTDVTDTHSFNITLNEETKAVAEGASNTWTVDPGTYSAIEVDDGNYDLVSISGPETVGSNGTATIYVVNKQKPATITVEKNVFAPDGTTDVTDTHSFNITLNEETKAVAEGASNTWTVDPGTYSAIEVADGDYELVSISGPETVGSNGTATIYVVNKQKPAGEGPTTTDTSVLGAFFEEEESPILGTINVLGIAELPFTGQDIMIVLAGMLLLAALLLIIVLTLRKRAVKK